MGEKTSHAKNMSAVKSKIHAGGSMAGGKRMGPSAPNMRKNPYSQKGGK